MQKRSQKSWSNCWTGHSQEIVIHQWNLAKTGLNKNNGPENPLISNVYDNNFNLNSNKPDVALKESKQALRSILSKKRSSLSGEYINNSSSNVCESFVNSKFYQNADSIALHYPVNNEIDPLRILGQSVEKGKRFFLPRIEGEKLGFYRVNDLEGLVLNKYGIYEPDQKSERADLEEIDIFAVPGIAFDFSGNRIGFGKGYYDKTLHSVPSNKIFGLCYYFQILDSLPSDRLDKKVGFLVSEEGIFVCKS